MTIEEVDDAVENLLDEPGIELARGMNDAIEEVNISCIDEDAEELDGAPS